MAKSAQLERLQRRLEAIPDRIVDAVAKAMEISAQEIVDLAKQLCPVDDGVLRDSIGWTWGAAPEGSIVLAATNDAAMRITIFAGNDEAFYARWVEFGTSKTAPNGFFFVSYRLLQKRAKGRTRRAISKGFKDARAGK